MKKHAAFGIILAFLCALTATFVVSPVNAGTPKSVQPVAIDISPQSSTVVTGQIVRFKATVWADQAKTKKITNAKLTWTLQKGAQSTAKLNPTGVYTAGKNPSVDTVTVAVNGTNLSASALVTVRGAFNGGNFTGILTNDADLNQVRLGLSATKTKFKILGMDINRDSAYDRSMTSFSGTINASGQVYGSTNVGAGRTITITGQITYDESDLPTLIEGTFVATKPGQADDTGSWHVSLDTAAGAGPKLGTYNVVGDDRKHHIGPVGMIVYTDPDSGKPRCSIMVTGTDSGSQNQSAAWGMFDDIPWTPSSFSFELYKESLDPNDSPTQAWGNGSYKNRKASGKVYSDPSMSNNTAMGIWSANDL